MKSSKRVVSTISVLLFFSSIVFISCEKGTDDKTQSNEETTQKETGEKTHNISQTDSSAKSSETKVGKYKSKQTNEIESTSKQIRSWLNDEAVPVLQKFEDRRKTAQKAPRFALSGHINKLKAARREWERLSPSNVYMQDYKKLVLSYMNNQITALTNFMSQDVSEIPLRISQYEKVMAGDYLYQVLKAFNIDIRKIKGPTIKTFSNKQIVLKRINSWQKTFRSEGGQFIRALDDSRVMDRQLNKMNRIEKYIKNGPWIFDANRPTPLSNAKLANQSSSSGQTANTNVNKTKNNDGEGSTEKIEAGQSLGSNLFEFSSETVSGSTITNEDLQGKVVIFNYWGTWSPPCVKEIPHLQEAYEKYKDRGFIIVGIAVPQEGQGGVDDVRSFMEKNDVTYPVIMKEFAPNKKLMEKYGRIRAIPTSFLVDRKGNHTETFVGYTDKETWLDTIFSLLDVEDNLGQ